VQLRDVYLRRVRRALARRSWCSPSTLSRIESLSRTERWVHGGGRVVGSIVASKSLVDSASIHEIVRLLGEPRLADRKEWERDSAVRVTALLARAPKRHDAPAPRPTREIVGPFEPFARWPDQPAARDSFKSEPEARTWRDRKSRSGRASTRTWWPPDSLRSSLIPSSCPDRRERDCGLARARDRARRALRPRLHS